MATELKYNATIILVMLFIAAACAWLSWYLWRRVSRTMVREAYEIRYQKDVEAQKRLQNQNNGDNAEGAPAAAT
jgi:hypothetical protein